MRPKLVAISLSFLVSEDRDRLMKLTNPGPSVFRDLLRGNPLYVHTLGLVATDDVGEWIGWALLWWRTREEVARVGVFVAPEHRRKGIGKELLWAAHRTATGMGMILRGNATEPHAADLFDEYHIENDARPT